MTLNRLTLALCTSLLLGACSTSPAFDRSFGDTVRMTTVQQTRDLEATERNADRPVDGLGGQAASNAINNYYESFSKPPVPDNVFNIGVGTSGRQGK